MNMPERDAFSPTGQRGKILINGKFLSAGPTGVHRVAEELVRALDLLLAEQGNGTLAPIEILCPNNTRHAVATRSIRQRKVGIMTLDPLGAAGAAAGCARASVDQSVQSRPADLPPGHHDDP